MVGADAGRHVGVERLPAQAGRVAVQRPACEALQLGQHLGRAVDHAGVVHHLGQPQHARIVQQRQQVAGLQPRAGRLHVGGWDAGRQVDPDAERRLPGRVEHEADAGQAVHVGNLVGVGDHRGGAARQHGARELRRGGHGAFDVNVGVEEAGSHAGAGQVDHLPGRVARPHPDDFRAGDGNVRGLDLAGEDVDQPGVAQQQIGRLLPAGEADRFCQGHEQTSLSVPECTTDFVRGDFTIKWPGRLPQHARNASTCDAIRRIAPEKKLPDMTRIIVCAAILW